MARIAVNTFEALFLKALQVEGPVVAELKAVGFDVARLEPSYDVTVWRAALDVAGRHAYPDLSRDQADYQLGARLVDGYFDTLVGKVMLAAFPLLSAEALCKRLPRYFASGIDNVEKLPELEALGPGHFRVTLFGDGGVPWFTCGAIDAVLARKQVQPRSTVADVQPRQFTIDIAYTAR